MPERIAFIALAVLCFALAFSGFRRIYGLVASGSKADRSDRLIRRFVTALIDIGLQKPIFKTRPIVGVFHAFIFFGFSFYLLVNVADVLEAYVPNFREIAAGPAFSAFNLFSDLFSVFVLTGMVFFLVRRFGAKPKELEFDANVKLHPSVAAGGVRRDSLIVGIFILIHVGSRWLGTAFHLASSGHVDPFMPTASLLSIPLRSFESVHEIAIHVCWWLAMGLILCFLPYFPRSKHLHLMVAPLNLALNKQTPRGRLEKVSDAGSPGAGSLSDLPWPSLLDGYACIMCNRCQGVCPAHTSGAPLSPAALEINKRYLYTEKGKAVVEGSATVSLLDEAITTDAVWSCTTCYACVRICPVGNEPMADLIEMRRAMVFDGNAPDELSEVLRGLDEKGNSFVESARKRARWAKALDFKIPDARKEKVEYLWFVGDFASYDPQCREVSQKVARILQQAGVSFGILYEGERSAGNDVRRVGEEGLFEALAEHNIAVLEECDFQKVFTTDPHTFNTLKNEYPSLGFEREVLHYSHLLLDLIKTGKIRLESMLSGRATYHDPCYLGRYNGEFDTPRALIAACGLELHEMPRHRENSFCCGAGGGRIWMPDHDDVTERPSENRIREALGVGGVKHFVVACPKDLTMYRDAVKTSGNEEKIQVSDIADLVAEAMPLQI